MQVDEQGWRKLIHAGLSHFTSWPLTSNQSLVCPTTLASLVYSPPLTPPSHTFSSLFNTQTSPSLCSCSANGLVLHFTASMEQSEEKSPCSPPPPLSGFAPTCGPPSVGREGQCQLHFPDTLNKFSIPLFVDQNCVTLFSLQGRLRNENLGFSVSVGEAARARGLGLAAGWQAIESATITVLFPEAYLWQQNGFPVLYDVLLEASSIIEVWGPFRHCHLGEGIIFSQAKRKGTAISGLLTS